MTSDGQFQLMLPPHRPQLPLIGLAEARSGRYFDPTPPKVREILSARDLTVLVSGPSGTGKTTAILERIRACCAKYERSRWLVCRSFRKWLSQSVLVTWENKVCPPHDLVPDRIRRDSRSEYRFRNGSVVVVAGLDDPQQVMSAEYDGIFVNEATEVNQATVETLRNRLRNGVMPYQQLILDCNPGPPTHWLKKEADAGRMRHITTVLKDNPAYYDATRQRWTRAGESYRRVLDTMTGNRRLRLRDGKWAQAEGVIYDGWSAPVHVVDRFAVPSDWVTYWTVDFGFNNPFVWQCWAIDPDGRVILVAEFYHTRMLVEDAAQVIRREAARYSPPAAVICDTDAEGRATLERHLEVSTTAAEKADVRGGIDAVAARLQLQPDGRPRLLVFRDALCGPTDHLLAETGHPIGLAQEMDAYVWHTDRQGSAAKDQPLKMYDHSQDACRYGVVWADQAYPAGGVAVEPELPVDPFAHFIRGTI